MLQEEVPGTMPGANELSDAKSARVLGSEITQAGVGVYDALQHERELQDARQRYAIASNSFTAMQHRQLGTSIWWCSFHVIMKIHSDQKK